MCPESRLVDFRRVRRATELFWFNNFPRSERTARNAQQPSPLLRLEVQLAYQSQRGAKPRRIKDFVKWSGTETVEGVESVESRISTSGFAQKLAGYDLIAAEARAEERSLLAVIRQASCVSFSEAKQIADTKPRRLRFVVKWFVKGLQ